jgi:hypothetical protein
VQVDGSGTYDAHADDLGVAGMGGLLLARVLEPLCAGLAARGQKAAALTLELTLASGRTHRRSLRPALPTGEARTWRTLLLLDLETHLPGDAVTALAVMAEPAPARDVQFSLLDPAQPSPEKLAETMARLQGFTAEGRGGAASLLDTHRPGAFVMATFATEAFEASTSRKAGGHSNDSNASPEPFETSTNRNPKGHSNDSNTPPGVFETSPPPSPRAALRVFRHPLRAEVVLKAGVPSFVAAPGIRGTVEDRAGQQRAENGDGSESDAQPAHEAREQSCAVEVVDVELHARLGDGGGDDVEAFLASIWRSGALMGRIDVPASLPAHRRRFR